MSNPLPRKKKLPPVHFLLLVLPFIALCWPPFYDFRDPQIMGIPFFYWFQLLWVIITAVITAVVYLLDSRRSLAAQRANQLPWSRSK